MPKRRKKRELSTLRVMIELIILIFFVVPFFYLHLLVGALYLITIGLAFYNRTIFQRKNISIMIIIGTLLAYFAGLLIRYAMGSYLTGNIISALILTILALLIWSKGRKLKKGKR